MGCLKKRSGEDRGKMLEELVEGPRAWLTLLLCVLLPVGVTAATSKLESTVQEFRVFRLAQVDYRGEPLGSRAWRVSHEATSVGAKTQIRRCLVVWWKDLAKEVAKEAAGEPSQLTAILHPALGSALVLLPKSLAHFTAADRLAFLELEARLLSQAWPIPVLFAFKTPALAGMAESLAAGQAASRGSALAALWDALTANAYQMVGTNTASSVALTKPLFNVVGRLSAYERGGAVRTLLVVAHYDSFGAAPALAEGADSNGSGVAALLELLRIFHRLYASSRTRPKYNMVFLLAGGGKLNFQGTRAWIEEHLEQEDSELELALCLDSLGGGRELFTHVSKEPKEDNPVAKLHRAIGQAAESKGIATSLVQKKISLAEPWLSWEHERFNIRKLRALTVSRAGKAGRREQRSILDTRDLVDTKALAAHVEALAEGLLSFVYELGSPAEAQALMGKSGVSWASLSGWVRRLGTAERSSAALAEAGKDSGVLGDLLSAVEAHSHSAELRPIPVDAKEPDFALYGATEDVLTVHRVKPAVFDLLLAVGIGAYLAAAYAALLHADAALRLAQAFASRFTPPKHKAH